MRSQKLLLGGLLLTGVLLVLPACGGGQSSPSPEKSRLSVVTSLSVFADLIRNVGGQQVEVVSLVPPGAEVHTFQPTPKDSVTASKADVAFLNGLGLDSFLEGVIRNAVRPGVPIILFTEGLAAPGDGSNPHLWLDVRLAITYVERIRDALASRDPANAAHYGENARRYIGELEELDREIERAVATIPTERRKLVTFHDAFPYFARRYGLELVGFLVGSSGEPSAKEVAELVQKIRSAGIPAVFVEPQFNARVLEVVAAEAGVRVGVLYNDALDERVQSYTALMRFNMRQVVEGLK